MMIVNNKILLLIGILLITIPFSHADVRERFGWDEHPFVIFPLLLPPLLTDSLLNKSFILDIILIDSDNSTQVIWDENDYFTGRDYLTAIYNTYERNKENLEVVENYPLPSCHPTWDDSPTPQHNGHIGIYYKNDGSEVRVINDSRCFA